MTEVANREKSEELIQRALVAVAACSGNGRAAARALAKEDIKIDHTTLYRWKDRYAEDYARIRAELLPKIREGAADLHRALEQRQLETSAQAVEELREELPSMETRDKIALVGKMDIGSGIHAEKAQMYDGEPTHIVQRSSEEILREMASLGMKVEAIDAEVVSEEDVAA